jgi:hypothetical protein
MSIVKALQGASANWLTRDFTGKTIFAAIVDQLTLDDDIKKKVGIALEPYADYGITIPGGALTTLAATLNGSQYWMVKGEQTEAGKKLFKKALADAESLITSKGVIKFYGEAQRTKAYAYIARKFDHDHLAKDQKAAKAHAEARLASPNVPASTSILEEYANALNENAKTLNEADVYKTVEWYLNTVKGWTVSDAVVDSIGFFSKTKVTAFTYTRAGEKLTETKVSGHLMYAAQANEEDDKVRLIYHYTAIEADPATPANFAKKPKTGSWKVVTYEEVAAKLTKLGADQKEKLKAAWPLIYYAG